jgi:hypothetical protein
MRRIELLSGVTVLALGFLSAVPGICAAEPLQVDTNGNVMGERATPGEGAALSLPLRTTENFTLDAITESSAKAVEADKLAKQLANPIASLISVPFQANEDCQPVLQRNFED